MKIFSCFAATALILASSLSAQDKPNENRMVFQPGSTVPSGMEIDPNPSQLKIDPALAKTVGDFFFLLRKKQIDEAYDQLAKGSKIADKPEDVVTLKKQTKKAFELFGAIQGFELVEVRPVGMRLVRVTCLSINKDLPLRWRFYFYRVDADWKLVDIGVNDRLIDLFEEVQPAAQKGVAPQQ